VRSKNIPPKTASAFLHHAEISMRIVSFVGTPLAKENHSKKNYFNPLNMMFCSNCPTRPLKPPQGDFYGMVSSLREREGRGGRSGE